MPAGAGVACDPEPIGRCGEFNRERVVFCKNTVWEKTNQVPGLQLKASICADFLGFAECVPQQWMGPFNEVAKSPDTPVG